MWIAEWCFRKLLLHLLQTFVLQLQLHRGFVGQGASHLIPKCRNLYHRELEPWLLAAPNLCLLRSLGSGTPYLLSYNNVTYVWSSNIAFTNILLAVVARLEIPCLLSRLVLLSTRHLKLRFFLIATLYVTDLCLADHFCIDIAIPCVYGWWVIEIWLLLACDGFRWHLKLVWTEYILLQDFWKVISVHQRWWAQSSYPFDVVSLTWRMCRWFVDFSGRYQGWL